MSGSLPLILALDTAQEDCAAALLKGTELIASRVETVGSRHSELILPMVRDLLAEAGVDRRQRQMCIRDSLYGSSGSLRRGAGFGLGARMHDGAGFKS